MKQIFKTHRQRCQELAIWILWIPQGDKKFNKKKQKKIQILRELI